MEIGTGTKDAALAPPGSELKSAETVGIGGSRRHDWQPGAGCPAGLQSLNQRLIELQVTMARVNDLLNDKNRADVSDGLGNLNSMLAEDRPKVRGQLDECAGCQRQVAAAAGRPQDRP